MSKILITGATGFIGNWLVRHFVHKNNHIIAHESSKESISNLKIDLKKESLNLEKIEFWEQNFKECLKSDCA